MSWIGMLPAGWSVQSLKRVAAVRSSNVDKLTKDDEAPVRLCNYVDVYHRDVIDESVPFMAATASETEIDRFRLRAGDVLITKDSEAWDDIAVPAYVPDEFTDVLCGYHLAQLRPVPSRLDGSFLRYALLAHPFRDQFRVRANGITRYGLSLDAISGSTLPVPPLERQGAIAGFLDRRTARIDRLVAKKRRLISLLEEKRTALITHAVTRGLDPHAPTKPSGIDWLGDVPTHWGILNLRRVATLKTGHTPSRSKSEYWTDCTIPWFGLVDVWQIRDGRRLYLGETAEKISRLGLDNSAAELLPAGTVVVSRTASVGFSGIMPKPMATTQDFVNWVCGEQLVPEYLLYFFRAMQPEFRRLTHGSTHSTIYMPDVLKFVALLPPLKEQVAVVAFIQQNSDRYFKLVKSITAAIDRLTEYRAALITAAVTGRIDVSDTGVEAGDE